MNKVGRSGRLSVGAHVAGNLSAMIGRMHHDMSKDVFDCAGIGFTLAVCVRHGQMNVARSNQIQMFVPKAGDFGGVGLALWQIVVGPYGRALGLLFDAVKPQPFGGDNMCHELERPLSRGAARPDRGQNFVVRPLIVGKLFAKIVGKVQKKPPLATTSILQWNVLLPRQAAL